MSLLGKAAPNVTLYDTSCQAVEIDSFKGKKLIIAFFPAAFTGVCTQEMCTFNNGIEELREGERDLGDARVVEYGDLVCREQLAEANV